jgi:thiol-disulfide isomerase/thioredoxin
MHSKNALTGLLVLISCFSLVQLDAQEQLETTFLASGITAKMGGYRPIRAEMDQSAEIVKKAPEDLTDPKFGWLELGEQKWAFLLDQPEDGDPTLYVDTNGDLDLTNDPKAKWEKETRNELTMFNGEAQIDLGNEELGTIKLYRFDPTDERRAQLKNTVLFYTDFGYEYKFTLDMKEFKTFSPGKPTAQMSLPVDRDGNGKLSRNYEQITLGEPFNFTGTTYEISLEDEKLVLKEAETEKPMLPMPPDLSIGKTALTFTATTMDGTEVEFPKSFAGKLVMLDFWATWCGPCIGEIPNMKEAYEQHHEDGFEILGISFDREEMTESINEFREKHEMPWPQIYEGKTWDTMLGKQHDVSAIPFVLLVDGDTGEILATAQQLRGEGLADFIGEQLKKKKGE